MSTQINDGGSAFPIADTVHPTGQVQYGANGMTLRDYFAGQAIAGIIACPQVRHDMFDAYARHAYAQADAMLAARNLNKETK